MVLTRHIVIAVSAASDGVKAWEILKEKSFKIDLVLTEVELPLMSGFLLLSTIMEHDACKNIPVISMCSIYAMFL
jgi:pseudo-response regulator 5